MLLCTLVCKGYFKILYNYFKYGVSNIEIDDALSYASQDGRLDIVKYLVEQGANIHSCFDEALNRASRFGHLHVVKYLVECQFLS